MSTSTPTERTPLAPPSTRRRLLAWLVPFAAVLALAVLAGAWRLMQERPSDAMAIGGPFRLIDGAGKTVTDTDLHGKYALIYFGYTFCPDVCPTTLAAMVSALDSLGAEADRVRPVFISVDPGRDTPAVVRDYVAAFSPRLLGLTGSADAIAAAARAYRVYYAERRTGNGPLDYSMDHSSVLYLMAPDGSFRSLVRTDETPAQMAADIRRSLS